MANSYDDDAPAPKSPGKSRETPAFSEKGSYGGHGETRQFAKEPTHPLHVSGSEQDAIINSHVSKKSKFGDVHGGKGC